MEGFEMWPKRKSELERITGLTDAAERLKSEVDLKRQPDGHIYKALDQAGIRDRAERTSLIGPIKAELHRRRRILIEGAQLNEARNRTEDDDTE